MRFIFYHVFLRFFSIFCFFPNSFPLEQTWIFLEFSRYFFTLAINFLNVFINLHCGSNLSHLNNYVSVSSVFPGHFFLHDDLPYHHIDLFFSLIICKQDNPQSIKFFLEFSSNFLSFTFVIFFLFSFTFCYATSKIIWWNEIHGLPSNGTTCGLVPSVTFPFNVLLQQKLTFFHPSQTFLQVHDEIFAISPIFPFFYANERFSSQFSNFRSTTKQF